MNKLNTSFLILPLTCMAISLNAMSQSSGEIVRRELPKTVKEQLDKKYSTYQIISLIQKTDTLNGNTFEMELQRKYKVVFLVFDNEGQKISERKSKMFTFDGTEPVRKSSPSHNEHNHTHSI